MASDKFRFRRHSSIGSAAAEEDEQFLSTCFVDTGDLTTLVDCRDPKRIILGRTGSGKTALLNRLSEEKDAILISPESLAFNYLTNSNILQFFLEAGVNLDLFFKLLWRHVFAVELIKKKYGITNEATKRSFLSRITDILVRDRKKERAIDYLMQWGDQFWEPTEYRVKEITGQIENELKGSVATKLAPVELNVAAATKLTEEQKIDVVTRGQAVINNIQMRELSEVLDFLNDDIFNDEKQCFYICIDRLDENWVDDKYRYVLIRSLIETIRDFLRVRNVKLIAVIRTDLIERVFRLTRGPGFQEEKYRSLFLQLRWKESQLKEILDRRVNYMVRQTYTKKPVGYKELLPSKIDKVSPVKYMLDRTLMRPRELIEFFNDCIELAEGSPTITKTMLIAAEGNYSKKRLRSLQDEWLSEYPSLIDFAFILRKSPHHFRVSDIDPVEVDSFCLDYATKHPEGDDILAIQARTLAEGLCSHLSLISMLLHVFYRTGIVGLKIETFESLQWCYSGTANIATDLIDSNTRVEVHPMFLRVLGIKPIGP
jgi:hypothetical protein